MTYPTIPLICKTCSNYIPEHSACSFDPYTHNKAPKHYCKMWTPSQKEIESSIKFYEDEKLLNEDTLNDDQVDLDDYELKDLLK